MTRSTAVTVTVVALALLCVAALAPADIGPKPTSLGHTPGPTGHDMAGIDVRMEEEDVQLLLRRDGPDREKLDVRAVFSMRNDGDTATFETGFPIGAYRNMDAFSVEIDGKRVDFDVVDRGAAPAAGSAKARRDPEADWWYVWDATYPGRAVSTHVVRYTVDLRRGGVGAHTGTAGYVLHTGAGWKGTIGRAVVTLRTGEGLTLDHIERLEPKTAGTRHEDRIEWTFTDLEPTKEHDVRVLYHNESLLDQIAGVREEAKATWSGRTRLASYLSRSPEHHFRDRMTDAELAGYLDALAAIIAERKPDDDRVALPGDTKDDQRGYTSDPNTIFRWMDAAADAVERHPESARAREVLRDYVALCETFLAGKLVVDGEPIGYAWRGPVDTPEQRARRDASDAKRRGTCEEWLARARRALSGD